MLIGEGEEKNKLLSLTKKENYQKFIIIKDFMQQEEMFNLLKKAKYFSLTSACYEVAPMSIIEALALDIIPIAPDIGGMKESINLTKVGITYKSNDINSWIEAINKLEKTYTERINELKEIKSDIIKELSIDNYIEKLTEIYYSFLD